VPGLLDYSIWVLCTLFEAGVVICAARRGVFRRYLALNLYMLASILVSIIRLKILLAYGFGSAEYMYCYYYSDLLLTIGLYCALMTLYVHVFEDLGAEQYVRLGAVLLLLGTAGFSFAIVQQFSTKILSHFVVEVSQNLYFVGLVLTYVLWGAILKLRETRTRLIQLVLALGLYFSLFAASYALRNLYPGSRGVWDYVTPLSGCILPLAWGYAFWQVPEEARTVPAHLVAVPR